jgi:transcriptional regulator with XRE-family HTH domain
MASTYESTNIKIFGLYLRHLRERCKKSLRQVEQETGVSFSHLAKIESGYRDTPKPDTLRLLAKSLHTNYTTLMDYAGYNEPYLSGFAAEEFYTKVREEYVEVWPNKELDDSSEPFSILIERFYQVPYDVYKYWFDIREVPRDMLFSVCEKIQMSPDDLISDLGLSNYVAPYFLHKKDPEQSMFIDSVTSSDTAPLYSAEIDPLVNELHANPELRVLLDASYKLDKEAIETITKLARQIQGTDHKSDDEPA